MKKKIKHYFFAPLIVLCLISSVFVGFSYYEAHLDTKKIYLSSHRNNTDLVAERINHKLAILKRDLSILNAKVEEISADQSRTVEELEQYVFNFVKNHFHSYAIYFSDTENNFFGFLSMKSGLYAMRANEATNYTIVFTEVDENRNTVAKLSEKKGFFATQRDWFQRAEKVSQGVWSDVFEYYALPLIAIPRSIAVRDSQDKLLGVLGGNYFISSIDEYLSEIYVEDDMFVVLMQGDRLLASSLPQSDSRIVNLLQSAELRQITELDKSGKKITELSLARENYTLLATKPNELHELGIYLVTAFDSNYYDSIELQKYTLHFLLLSIALVILYLMTYYLVRRVLKPLNDVEQYFKSKVVDSESKTEIPALMFDSNIAEMSNLKSSINTLIRAINSHRKRQRQLVEEKQQSIDRLECTHKIIEQTLDGIALFDLEQKLIWANRTFTNFWRLSPGDRDNFKLSLRYNDTAFNRFIACIELENQAPYQAELKLFHYDQHCWLDVEAQAVSSSEGQVTHYFVIQRDITADKEKEQSLLVWENVFENANWGIAVSTGVPPVITKANQKFCDLVEYSSDELIGVSVQDIYTEDARQGLSNLVKKVEVEGKVSFESELQKKDGKKFAAYINLSAIKDEHGNVQARVANVQDLTEIRELENQLFQAQKMESLGHLTSGIVHDFNNILASIITNVEVVEIMCDKSNSVNKDYHQFLDAAKDSATRASELVEQLLLFSRKSDFVDEEISVDSLLSDMKTMIKPHLPEHITLHLEDKLEAPCFSGNDILLKQCLLNLVINAIEAIKEKEQESGEITVAISQAKDSEYFALSRLKKWLKITVTDNGVGVEDALKEKIFEPFYTSRPRGKGSGLGLSIVLKAVKAHDGYINIESELGKGTSFHLFLPYKISKPKADKLEPIYVERESELRVLLIDDNESLLLACKEGLEKKGFLVTIFTDPLIAKQNIESPHLMFDLVVCDFKMPHLTGIEMLIWIRTFSSRLPFILCAGNTDEIKEKGLAEQNQATYYLNKPFKISQLELFINLAYEQANSSGS